MEIHGGCPKLPRGAVKRIRPNKKMANGEAEKLAINQMSLTGVVNRLLVQVNH